MAEIFTGKILILAAILGSWLPIVTVFDYNTCKGGLVPQTCQAPYSSHCCKSGAYFSATCCLNSCAKEYNTCYRITDSMCCSTTLWGSKSCCNYASYLRTSKSRTNHEKTTTFAKCYGAYNTEYCTNSLSLECCSNDYTAYASCCIPSTCGGGETCRRTSTYCCSSPGGLSCCDYTAYEKSKMDYVGGIAGGLFGGILLLVIIIVVPVSVICCCGRRRERDQPDTTAPSGSAASNHAQPYPAFQQLTYQYQPPPNEHQQPPPFQFNQQPPYGNQPPATELRQPPANGNQPPPYEHHEPSPSGIDQPPAYDSLPQFHAPLAPPPQPGPTRVAPALS